MEGKGDVLPILDRITSNSEETVGLMRDTVWAINPENDSTDRLIERMRSFGAEILAAKNINFRFEAPLLKNKAELSMEQRRNLYLVYKEAINNIVKHSGAKNAECVLEKKENGLTARVTDDGKGFDPSKSFEGHGLKNFLLRSRDSDLSVTVQSAPGKGATVEIRLVTLA
ncbi:MAG: ATP-binding protein [Leadbetterella sp.]|nr:ATP-binding protein [Leadbetterella sp.]